MVSFASLLEYRLVVTNGENCFQRIMDSFIWKEELGVRFDYSNNITIFVMTENEHDAFLEAENSECYIQRKGMFFLLKETSDSQ